MANPIAPTGRNLPAKGVSPGTAEQTFFGPEGDASTAGIERIDVVAINPIRTAHPTTIHVREEDPGIHPGTKPFDDGFPGSRCKCPNSRRCVPFRDEKRRVPLYQGSRPSLADYGPLGLDAVAPAGCDRTGPSARIGRRSVVRKDGMHV